MEAPILNHMKTIKQIICYIKGTLDYGLYYSPCKKIKFVGYSDNDCDKDINDQNNTNDFVFFMGDTVLTWSLKKQSIVIL